MSKHWTIVTIEKGDIVNKKAVRVLFSALKDGSYFVEINSREQRSGQQNKYYWALVVPMLIKGFKDLGHDLSKDEVHEFLKAKFNYLEIVNTDSGEITQVPVSTTRLNKEQFAEYIEKIQRFAAEWLSMEIPDAGKQTELYDTENTIK